MPLQQEHNHTQFAHNLAYTRQREERWAVLLTIIEERDGEKREKTKKMKG